MNGAGNDFVLFDNRDRQLKLTRDQIVRLCHRQRGIGADGIILLVPADGRADWAWDFYNSDGSAAEMCGNGARCFARFVKRKLGISQSFTFATGAGIVGAEFDGPLVSVTLTPPKDSRMGESIQVGSELLTVHSLNTGVPHAVLIVPDADRAMVQPIGSQIRFHPHFAPKGTNVNFVQVLSPGSIRVRTYERGVEGETLACGTGVTASALVAARLYGFASPIAVRVQGGETLEVSFQLQDAGFQDVRLKGPAEFAFEGQVQL